MLEAKAENLEGIVKGKKFWVWEPAESEDINTEHNVLLLLMWECSHHF